tara:strand:+ start:37495 stop:38001 length:507 start_codon:yes stop_codon:yes gene_type:complete
MQFSVGDKVLFKKERLCGKIIKIHSLYKAAVLTEDGFEINVSLNNLVRIEQGTDKIASYGKVSNVKDFNYTRFKSVKSQKKASILRVDLHIELLTTDYHNMSNIEIVQLQLDVCEKNIHKALHSNFTSLQIIHGIGEGTLRKEVHNILREYKLRFYLSQDGGATEVIL